MSKMSKMPIPTTLTLCLVALGIAAAAIWGWQAALVFDLGILLLVGLDYAMVFRGGNIQAEHICPYHFSPGTDHDIEVLLRNTSPSNRRVQVRDQTPMDWQSAPILKAVVPGRSSLSLDYQVVPPQRGVYGFGNVFLRV